MLFCLQLQARCDGEAEDVNRWRYRRVSVLTVGVLETTINQLTTTYSRVIYQSPLDHNISGSSSSC